MGLSLVSTKRPASLSAVTTATLAWKRFIPYNGFKVRPWDKSRKTDLELLSSTGIQGSVIVEDVDERKIMTDSNLIIVSVVCGGNLDSSGAELHVNDDRVRDYWNSAVNEWVDGKFPVKVLQLVQTSDTERGFMGTYGVPGVVRVDRNCGISEHGFRSGGGNDDLFVCGKM